MAQQPGFPWQPGPPAGQRPGGQWPGGPTPPDWRPNPPGRTPSGLFPSGSPARPARPGYREPHPVRPGAVAAGSGAATAWMLAFGLLGRDLAGYLWWTLLAGVVAWLAALALVRMGDRGVAVGISIITAIGWSVASAAAAVRWAVTGDWPMWG